MKLKSFILRTFAALGFIGCIFSPTDVLDAQSVTTPVITRPIDSIANGSVKLGFPATYDSSRVKFTVCVQVRTRGINSKEVCRTKTGPWLQRVVVAPPSPVLTRVELLPSETTVDIGQVRQFSFVGVWSNSSAVVAIPAVFNVTGGTITSNGLFTAGNQGGIFRVIATHQASSLADTSVINVQVPPVLTGITLNPDNFSLLTNETQTLTIAGRLSDGSSTVPSVTLRVTGGTISGQGANPVFTAGTTPGTYRIIAESGTFADTSNVTITTPVPVLTDVVLTPSNVSLLTGATQQFTVAGTWTNGGTAIPSVTFSSNGGTVSTNGLFTAGSVAGAFRVIATHASGLADTSNVTISAPSPVLTGISLTPSTANITAGGTQQFSVAGIWTNGGTGTPSVTYTTSGGTINNGLFSSSTSGTFLVIASTGTFSDTSTVVVTPVVEIPPSGDEPVFQSGTNTLIKQDEFETYSGKPSNGWLNTPEGTSIISDGRSGKAVRIAYTPSSYTNGIDLGFGATNKIFVSYWFRVTAGFYPSENDNTNSGMKWFTLWRQSDPRQTWGVGNLTWGPGVQNTNFGTHDNSSSDQPNMSSGGGTTSERGVWSRVNDGNWHRYTIEAYTGTGTNGYERAWVDGVKIFDSFGRGYHRSTQGFNLLQIGHDKVRPPLGTRNLDIDGFIAWK